MRDWLIRTLTRLLHWLEPPPVEIDVSPVDPLDAMAWQLVELAERIPETSGEYKRHWVYARLLKDFPMRPKRDAALAIELAIQARGDS